MRSVLNECTILNVHVVWLFVVEVRKLEHLDLFICWNGLSDVHYITVNITLSLSRSLCVCLCHFHHVVSIQEETVNASCIYMCLCVHMWVLMCNVSRMIQVKASNSFPGHTEASRLNWGKVRDHRKMLRVIFALLFENQLMVTHISIQPQTNLASVGNNLFFMGQSFPSLTEIHGHFKCSWGHFASKDIKIFVIVLQTLAGLMCSVQ